MEIIFVTILKTRNPLAPSAVVMVYGRVMVVAVVGVLDDGSRTRPEHDVPQGHEDSGVQSHIVEHERLHDEHLEVGQYDGSEAPRDQLRYEHHGVHHKVRHLHSSAH